MESHANASTALTPNHCRKTDQYESLGEWFQLHIALPIAVRFRPPLV